MEYVKIADVIQRMRENMDELGIASDHAETSIEFFKQAYKRIVIDGVTEPKKTINLMELK